MINNMQFSFSFQVGEQKKSAAHMHFLASIMSTGNDDDDEKWMPNSKSILAKLTSSKMQAHVAMLGILSLSVEKIKTFLTENSIYKMK